MTSSSYAFLYPILTCLFLELDKVTPFKLKLCMVLVMIGGHLSERTFVRLPVNKHSRTNVRSDKCPFPGHLSDSDHMLLASTLERELADSVI